MKFLLVTYDVTNDKRRNKLADALLDYGHRVQYSVFELWLNTSDEKYLMKRIRKILNTTEDSLRIYTLCTLCCQRVQVIGTGQRPSEPDVIII